MDQSKMVRGYFLTFHGLVFALAGLGIMPFAFEFGFAFLMIGSGTILLAVIQASTSRRQRIVFQRLALSSYAAAGCGIGAMMIASKGGADLGIYLFPAAIALWIVGWLVACRHPNYVYGGIAVDHSDSDQAPSDQTRQVSAQMTEAKPPKVLPSSKLAESELQLDIVVRERWKRGLRYGIVAGLLPLIFFGGAAIVTARSGNNPAAPVVFGVIAIVFSVSATGFVALFYVVVTGLSNLKSFSTTKEHARFAARVGGSLATTKVLGLTIPQNVEFQHGKNVVVLDTESHRTSNRNSITYTRITFELSTSPEFTCSIFPQGTLSQVATFFGSQDVQVGWDDFDDCFMVKTNDEFRAPSILDRDVQLELLALREFASHQDDTNVLGTGYAALSIFHSHVQVKVRGYLAKEADLFEFYQICGRLYDLLASRLK